MADVRRLDRSKKKEPAPEPPTSRAASLMQSRKAPEFYILSHSLEVLFSSPGNSAPQGPLDPILENCVRTGLKTLADTKQGASHWMPYRDNQYVRVIPIEAPGIDCIALFFDRTRSAASLSYAIRFYKFSKREADVLGLLTRGYDTIEIAQALSIAPSTARDHIVSMMRKTSSHRRAELLATALNAAEAPGSEATG